MVITEGHLLNGRVMYRQPTIGFRSGIEPVLLAASVPVRPGEHVLEAGTGAGAALLCLSARVPGVVALGVEVDPTMADLAMVNASINGFTSLEVIAQRIETVSLQRDFDHVIANPPYHQPDGTVSPNTTREVAKRGSVALLGTWIGRLAEALRHRGSMTLIVPSGMISACMAAMTEHHCPCTILFPLWPKTGRAAKLVLLRGVKGGRTVMALAPGLVLHNPNGSFTEAAEAVLGNGATLALDG